MFRDIREKYKVVTNLKKKRLLLNGRPEVS